MRFRQLDLARYGHFMDFGLDFGEPPTEGPDLHLIYGPNEAGKSTIFAAIVDLLFGFPQRSPYGFRHDNNALRIEATLDGPEGRTRLARIKRLKADLLGAGDNPISAGVLTAGLGGLDRDGFVAMFSLDEATLAKGGSGLIDAEGDFGQLLYGASAGVAELGARLAAINADADKIHRPNARAATELRGLHGRLEDLRTEKRRIDVAANEYRKLAADQAAARQAEAEADTALRATRQAADLLERRARALPLLADLADNRAALAPLLELAEVPAGWDDRTAKLLDARTDLRSARVALTDQLETHRRELAAMPEEDAILAFAERLENAAFASQRSRYETAVEDIPSREARLADLDRDIADAARRLESEDAASLRLAPDRLGEIERLLTSWPDIRADRDAAAKELAKAKAALGDADAIPADGLAWLEAALAEADASDVAARLGQRRETVAKAVVRRDAALKALGPWSGDAAALAELPVLPAATIAGWTKARTDAANRIAQFEGRVADLAEKHASAADDAIAAARLAALDDDAFAALRQKRDTAWTAHLENMTPDSATAFASLLDEADAAADARMTHATAIAQARAADGERVKAGAALDRARATLDAEAAKLAAIDADLAASAQAIGLPATTDLAALQDWLARRDVALKADEDHAAEAAAAAIGETEVARLAARLRASLEAANAPAPADAELTGLRRLARAAFDRLRDAAKAASNLEGRERAHATSEAEVAHWRAAWTIALAGTWLEGAEPETAREKLALYRDIEKLLQERDSLQHRVREMRADRAAFHMLVADLAQDLGAPLAADADALRIADGLGRRLNRARTEAALRGKTAEAVATTEAALQALTARGAAHAAEVSEVIAHFGVETLDAAGTAVRQIAERSRVLLEQRRLERDILAAADAGEDLAATETALAGLDAATLAGDGKAAADRVEAAETANRAAIAARALAEKAIAAIGDDGRAAALEQERQTVLMEIEAAAERYLKLKLGALATERALESYRARHRTDMLERASQTFATITRGSFRGLTTQADGAREKLIAVRGDGAARLVDLAMSVGTRAQLYLALRVAGYHEFARTQPPPPFVADDIFETYDDMRAEETFAVLAEMAQQGQVIYLTHHPHLKEIARRAAPGVRIHDLPDPVAAPGAAPGADRPPTG